MSVLITSSARLGVKDERARSTGVRLFSVAMIARREGKRIEDEEDKLKKEKIRRVSWPLCPGQARRSGAIGTRPGTRALGSELIAFPLILSPSPPTTCSGPPALCVILTHLYSRISPHLHVKLDLSVFSLTCNTRQISQHTSRRRHDPRP